MIVLSFFFNIHLITINTIVQQLKLIQNIMQVMLLLRLFCAGGKTGERQGRIWNFGVWRLENLGRQPCCIWTWTSIYSTPQITVLLVVREFGKKVWRLFAFCFFFVLLVSLWKKVNCDRKSLFRKTRKEKKKSQVTWKILLSMAANFNLTLRVRESWNQGLLMSAVSGGIRLQRSI